MRGRRQASFDRQNQFRPGAVIGIGQIGRQIPFTCLCRTRLCPL